MFFGSNKLQHTAVDLYKWWPRNLAWGTIIQLLFCPGSESSNNTTKSRKSPFWECGFYWIFSLCGLTQIPIVVGIKDYYVVPHPRNSLTWARVQKCNQLHTSAAYFCIVVTLRLSLWCSLLMIIIRFWYLQLQVASSNQSQSCVNLLVLKDKLLSISWFSWVISISMSGYVNLLCHLNGGVKLSRIRILLVIQ